MATFYLTIIKALNLPSHPTSGYPNPFIVINAGNTTKQTKTLSSARDPIYNETFQFHVNLEDSVSFIIYDEAKTRGLKQRNTLAQIGSTEMKLKECERSKLTETWLPVKGTSQVLLYVQYVLIPHKISKTMTDCFIMPSTGKSFRKEMGRWSEYHELNFFTSFIEIARNDEVLILFDTSRNVHVCISQGIAKYALGHQQNEIPRMEAFTQLGDGQWVEESTQKVSTRFFYGEGGFCSFVDVETGVWHEYKGKKHFASFSRISTMENEVLLYDSKRGIYVHINGYKCQWGRGSISKLPNSWKFLSLGKWV